MSSTITPFARSFLFNKVDAKFAKQKHPQLLPYIHIVHTHHIAQIQGRWESSIFVRLSFFVNREKSWSLAPVFQPVPPSEIHTGIG